MSSCVLVAPAPVRVCLIAGTCLHVCLFVSFMQLNVTAKVSQCGFSCNPLLPDNGEKERKPKKLCNFELELKNVFMPYSQRAHIWAGVIRGYEMKQESLGIATRSLKKTPDCPEIESFIMPEQGRIQPPPVDNQFPLVTCEPHSSAMMPEKRGWLKEAL